MTFQEKKLAIIERIQGENSEELISKMYDDLCNPVALDSFGENALDELLEQSQQEFKEGMFYINEQVKEMPDQRIESTK
jgi:hypothetical protein